MCVMGIWLESNVFSVFFFFSYFFLFFFFLSFFQDPNSATVVGGGESRARVDGGGSGAYSRTEYTRIVKNNAPTVNIIFIFISV